MSRVRILKADDLLTEEYWENRSQSDLNENNEVEEDEDILRFEREDKDDSGETIRETSVEQKSGEEEQEELTKPQSYTRR